MANQTTPAAPPQSQDGQPRSLQFLSAGRLLSSRRDNIDLLKALFLGAVTTALFYEVFPLPFIEQGRILTLFDNPVSEVITGMTIWSLFLLLFKYVNFRVQVQTQRAFSEPSVQAVLSQGIYARNVDEVMDQLRNALEQLKVKKFEASVMYRRVAQVLHFIRTVPKKESINDLLNYQSQIDVKKLETGYTLLQVFIWAIPILGFIGTVLGIGESVHEFSVFIQTAEGGAQFSTQMRTALGGVTSGLAVAFNTTFLALVLVIPVMVVTSFLQKNEEEILLFVEEFCLEDLLPHLHIMPANEFITESFDEHMHRILQLSNNWLGQLEPLVTQLSQQTEMVSHQIEGVQPLLRDFTDGLLTGENTPHRPAASAKPVAPAKPPRRRAQARTGARKPRS
ncbi:MAG: MotA/TolQ/ExbB proton channel family protein [SAR324 cluster bacterium]|nr:MotA/TolQ/ExbB proton channel family protein [SAR324 cluster bacterium]